MLVTSPTWTPRSLTLAPFSMTSPARSDTRVSGWKLRSVPENSMAVSTLSAMTTRSRTGAHQMGSIFSRRAEFAISPSPRKVEVAGLPVHGQRDGQQDEDTRGDRQADRAANGLADASRATGHGIAVVGVDRHHSGGHRQRLDERPQQVRRLQEGVEAGVVDAGWLPGGGRGAESWWQGR